ncbi:LPS-assembly protein LptD [Candidatus Thiothrix anitrata]|uniref:LPS-assembly protein LptD n=1 Tax=Candidatus Thiothrix anitrata TaxID=2823902 RepID=A0ABX7X2F1_9GAMM|nr:LPS assembly protein LptD [Candidatus Thiothrix anitrata]QTR50096.1 LPS assembly protein LptD [Candidatus Thiothrix anitrata]
MASSTHKTLTFIAALGLSVSPTVALAQTQWMSCPILPYPTDNIERPADLPPQAVHIEANTALFREQGVSEMSGDVQISQQDKKMRADNATYEQSSSQVTGKGNVTFSTPTLKAKSTDFNYNLNQDKGELQNADYRLPVTEGRGSSKRIVRESPQLTRLEQASYTTCPPGNAAWSLNSPNIRLYHEQEQGTATNVTLKIRKVPILYLPYISFPLTDKRKSGFLFPVIGSTEKTGIQAGIPYYFNLAPNYDMTLTPTTLSKRGLQLGTEFRYLTEKHQGEVKYTLLPNDKIGTVSNRYYYDLKHNTQIDERSSVSLKAEGVSDDQYFVDLGNSLQATSEVNLERRLTYQTSGDKWTFSAMTQDYQVLDGGTKPHSRLPQLLLNYRPLQNSNGVDMQINTEYTKFSGSKTATNGSRLDLKTTVSKNFANDAAYIKPSVSLRHSEYTLDDANKTRVSRTLPTATVDAGLFFEREVKQGQYLQTLEPRLYYTQTPYKDQSSIPVFDSSENTFSYGQLFSENRFTGKDRIEDANRLSASVTTRFQDQKSGREVLRASVGQIYHFDERKVTLPGQTAQTGKRSEIVFETGGQLNPRTNLSSTTFWDSDTKKLTANQVDLRYKDDKKRIVNVGYTKRKDEFEAGRLSFVAPVKENWKAIGGVEYDLLNNRNLESVVGAEYESCCWKTRVAGRNYLLPDNKTRDNAVFIEFELKGLGNFGSGTRDLLQDRVYGYE